MVLYIQIALDRFTVPPPAAGPGDAPGSAGSRALDAGPELGRPGRAHVLSEQPGRGLDSGAWFQVECTFCLTALAS